tara:strand:+ start:294 stop:914 length:621 start_codon:yes stop_codon:yes gene_type:complete
MTKKETITKYLKEYTELCIKYNIYIDSDYGEPPHIYLDYEIKDSKFVNKSDEIIYHIKELLESECDSIRIKDVYREHDIEFEWYEGEYSTEEKFTITNRNLINISAACYNKYVLNKDGSNKYNYALLGYDTKTNIVGIKLLVNKQKGAKLIRRMRKRVGRVPGMISASRFLNINNIKHDVSTSYKTTWHKKDRILSVTLDDKYKKE